MSTMPHREPAEERPVFSDDRSGVGASGSAESSTTRDNDVRAAAVREPIPAEEPFVDDSAAANGGDERRKLSVREILDRLILHEDRPIENLPTMKAAELKLIGRCVSLCKMQNIDGLTEPFHYTGLIASVSATAVTLVHVNRYTHADFKIYLERERNIGKDGYRAHTATVHNEGHDVGLPSQGYTTDGEVDVGADGVLTSTNDAAALVHMDVAGSLTPALTLPMEEDLQVMALARQLESQAFTNESGQRDVEEEWSAVQPTRAARHRHFRAFDGSVGPIPYVTFLRKNIHDVHFGRDPRSAFYSLFQDPAKQITDTQYLRMFVRRYLVHTSQGNNPREVPLYAFVSVRCAWPTLDRELVNQIVHEELPRLMAVDRGISKESKRQRHRESRGAAAILSYRAPAGLFHRTGILYMTNIPQMTFVVGVGVLFFTVAFSIFYGVVLGVLGDQLIVRYALHLIGFIIPSILVWVSSGALIILQSLTTNLPLQRHRTMLIIRAIWSVGSVVCVVMVVVELAARLRNEMMVEFMDKASTADLCAFYRKYTCSGFMVSCAQSTTGMCRGSCSALSLYSNGCYEYVWSRTQLVVIPLLVLSVIVGLLAIYSLFLLWKMLIAVVAIINHIRGSPPQTQ